MTDKGRAFVLARLSDAPDLPALRRAWDSIARDYQRDPEIQAHKERMKEALKE